MCFFFEANIMISITLFIPFTGQHYTKIFYSIP
nr:MAG TPA: hypothetical protein [Caudoviricetes sp.]